MRRLKGHDHKHPSGGGNKGPVITSDDEIGYENIKKEKDELLRKLESKTFLNRYIANWKHVTGEDISLEDAQTNIRNQIDFTAAGPDQAIVYPYVGSGNTGTTYSPYSNSEDPIVRRNASASFEEAYSGSGYGDDALVPAANEYPWSIGLQYDRRGDIYTGDWDDINSDGKKGLIRHELAHSYNGYNSPLFKPTLVDWKSNYGHYSAEGSLKDVYEDIFGPNFKKYSGHAVMPGEISSAKAETEGYLLDEGIWDNTKEKFGPSHIDKMLNDKWLDVSGNTERLQHLRDMGFGSLQRNTKELQGFNKSALQLDRVKRAGSYTKPYMQEDLFYDEWLKNNSKYPFNDDKRYGDNEYYKTAQSIVENSKRKKGKKYDKALEFIDGINKIRSNADEENINNYRINLEKKISDERPEVERKMSIYFNELVQNDEEQPVMAKYGREVTGRDGSTYKLDKKKHGGNHHEAANYGLSSVYNKDRYSKKAQSYRRFKKGGQVLDVYSSKGEKKGKGVNGRELYNGPYKDMTLKDFWDWDTMDYKKNSEGISFQNDPEYKNWRSKDRGYSGDELLNWYMYTQFNSEGTDITNRSEWEGQNFGHVRMMDRVRVSDDPNEDVMIRKENGMPYFKAYNKDMHEHLLNRKNANDPEASWYPSSQSEAFGMAKDLGLNNFFYEGKPVSTQTKEDVQKQENEYKNSIMGLRAVELYDKIVESFDNNTYRDYGDLKTYVDNALKDEYSHTDDDGNSTIITGKDMQNFRKSYKDETGVDLYDKLFNHYDNLESRSIENQFSNLLINRTSKTKKKEEESYGPDFSAKVDNTYVSMPDINIATEDKEEQGFVINGKWYPKGTQVLSEDKSTPRERKRKQQVYDDREKIKNYADLVKYNTNYSLGLSRSDQNHKMIDKLANSGITYDEFKNHIDNSMPSLNGAVEFGLLGYGAAAPYSIPLKIGKHFKNAKALSKLGNVSKIASRPLTYGDATNFAYATVGTIGYTPRIIENVKEGNVTGAVGNTLGLGLSYVGVPSSFKNFNRQLDLGFKQYNRFPTTAQGFQTAFPNTSRAHSLSNNSQFNATYDNIIGPTIGNSPRFNMFGPSQNDLLRKAKTYDKSLLNAPSQSTINKLIRQ